jgi:hypothetical protein
MAKLWDIFCPSNLHSVTRGTPRCACLQPGPRPSAPAWSWPSLAMSDWRRMRCSHRSMSAAGPHSHPLDKGAMTATAARQGSFIRRLDDQTPARIGRYPQPPCSSRRLCTSEWNQPNSEIRTPMLIAFNVKRLLEDASP